MSSRFRRHRRLVRHGRNVSLVAVLTLVAACRVDPLIPPAAGEGGAQAALVDVTCEPPAPLSAVPPVLRLHLAGASVDPSRIALVSGHAGPSQLAEVRRGQISAALSERVVPAQIWSDPAGGEDGGGAVLAPTVALDPGKEYTLLSADRPDAIAIQVAAGDGTPLLGRIWPPEGGSASDRAAVWCGDAPLAPIDEAAELSPSGAAGRLVIGVAPGDPGARCLRFDPSPDPDGGGAGGGVPPARVSAGGRAIQLDPRELAKDVDEHPPPPLPCVEGEVPFGPACAAVSDDRIEARSPGAPLLWSIQGEGIDRVFAAAPGEPFVVSHLPPSSAVALSLTVVDDGGAALHSLFLAQTPAPRPHLILNEVYANPLGPEPQQEWVEILNDGSMIADLTGYSLTDVGGEAVLSTGALPPGGFALIVNATFTADDGLDPAPEKGALLVRVAKLGKGGLANAGEPLTLRDPEGAVVSRFPAIKTKPGKSASRAFPAAPDALASAFALGAPTPGGPNAP
jgi:Lamin Tail Domain